MISTTLQLWPTGSSSQRGGPVVAVAQRDRIAPWLAIAIELDDDRISTHAAVVDHPFFVGTNLCGFLGGVVVDDREGVAALADGGFETIRHIELDDGPIVAAFEIVPGVAPVVGVVQRDGITKWLAVAHQLHADRIWTLAAIVDDPNFSNVDGLRFLFGVDTGWRNRFRRR